MKGLKNAFFMPFSWLQMMIRRSWPPANYHPEEKLGILGLRSSKSTFGGNNYIDFFVRLIFRDWVLRNWVSLEYYLTVIEVNPEK